MRRTAAWVAVAVAPAWAAAAGAVARRAPATGRVTPVTTMAATGTAAAIGMVAVDTAIGRTGAPSASVWPSGTARTTAIRTTAIPTTVTTAIPAIPAMPPRIRPMRATIPATGRPTRRRQRRRTLR